MTRMIRVGVIGLGRMGMLHLMSCQKIDGVQVVGVADSSKKNLAKAKALGVDEAYTDYHELLNHPSKMDAVILSLPNFMHFESVKSALENGLNVFVEKPLAPTVSECKEIVRLAAHVGRKIMVGHVMRFEEAVDTMRGRLENGFIGDLEVATIEEIINGPFSHPRVPAPVSDWWFDPKRSGGGALLDVGYHMIDLYRYLAGEAKVTYAHLSHRLNLPVEDGAIVLLQSTSSHAKGIVNVGWYQQTVFPKYNFRILLHGTAGYLSSDDFVPKNLYRWAVKEGAKNVLRRIVARKVRYLSYTYHYEPFYRELEHFFDCIRRDVEPAVSAADGLKTVELIEAAYDKGAKERDRMRV